MAEGGAGEGAAFEGLGLGAAIRRVAACLAGSGAASLDARLLVGAATGLDQAGLIAAERRPLTAREAGALEALLARRLAHEPMAYLTGVREFWSMPFRVAPGLLVPRPDSETLVMTAQRRRTPETVRHILDLGTGTGCLLGALLSVFPEARGLGLDRNPVAVETARDNFARLGLADRATARSGDWTAPGFVTDVGGPFDLVVANPPYIAEGARASLPPEVRDHEDPGALFSGADGLDDCRRILGLAATILSPSGLMIIEIGADQGEAALALARAALPGATVGVGSDLGGRPRALHIDRIAGKGD